MRELHIRRRVDETFLEDLSYLYPGEEFSLEISRVGFDRAAVEEILPAFQKGLVCKCLIIISCRHIHELFDMLGSLSSLTIEEITLVNPGREGVESLGWQLTNSTMRIKSLNINSSITMSIARSLSQLIEYAHLETLDLSHCHWDPDAVNILAEALSTTRTLRRLDLNSCHIEDSRMAGLLHSLQDQCALRDLNIAFNNCHSDACSAVASLLRTSKIERLVLSQQFIGREKCLDIYPLIAALSENKFLQFLDLKENSIAPGQVKELLSALASNDTLKELVLDCTDIGDDGLLMLAGELHNTKLASLSLLRNPFTDAGPLVTATTANGKIHQIRVDDAVAGRGPLSYQMALNQLGRGILSAHEVVPSLWPLVLERASKLDFPRDVDVQTTDILFYMMRGPALLCLCQG
jgi:Leucine Rich repeat